KDIENAIQDAPGIAARAKENEQLMSDGSVEGLTARTGQFSEHQKKLLERLKAQGRANVDDLVHAVLITIGCTLGFGGSLGSLEFSSSGEDLRPMIGEIGHDRGNKRKAAVDLSEVHFGRASGLSCGNHVASLPLRRLTSEFELPG
ncbi:MAG: hypothetical protein AAF488_14410, partial [Planctomycetota bacterium]